VKLRNAEEREKYESRIVQRLNIRVADFSVLNIHQLGIDAPVAFVWDMAAQWRPDAGYWPNDLARIVFAKNLPNHIEIFLLGRTRPFLGLSKRLFGLDYIPLFSLDILKREATPSPTGVDNARYFLYRCHGGYPIGIFSLYVRSSIPSEGERETTQLFFVVSFDFFGKKDWLGTRLVRLFWEPIHNRVTAHSLIRFKAHCESAFARVQAGVGAPVNGVTEPV